MKNQDDDPLHPFMPAGDGQQFRDWLDFVDKVARPLIEADGAHDAEQAAMRLYRKVNPYFICAALVMAANRALSETVCEAIEELLQAEVTVKLEDLRLLLQHAEPLLCRTPRVSDAIDRMGDALCKVTQAQVLRGTLLGTCTCGAASPLPGTLCENCAWERFSASTG